MIHPAPPAANQPGRPLAVHSIDEFVLVVPDLALAARFYGAFGLDVREDKDGLALYTFGHPHRWGRLIAGSRKHLHHISFGCYEVDLLPLRRRLVEAGIDLINAPPGFEGEGLWFRDWEGNLIEIKVAPKTSPDTKSSVDFQVAQPGERGALGREQSPKVQPRRFAHLLMFTADIDLALKFYQDSLGLRLSDRARDAVAFMHGPHGSDHHLIAMAKSAGPGLHHLSWDVGSIDEIGQGAQQMAAFGYSEGWGLGRHVLGSNYFFYVRDPWNSYCEYSCGIDYVPKDAIWPPVDTALENALYLFGPVPPADFIKNYELMADPPRGSEAVTVHPQAR